MEIIYTPEQVREALQFIESMGTDRFLELSDYYCKSLSKKQVRASLRAWDLLPENDKNPTDRFTRGR
jgi:hypothetical protein